MTIRNKIVSLIIGAGLLFGGLCLINDTIKIKTAKAVSSISNPVLWFLDGQTLKPVKDRTVNIPILQAGTLAVSSYMESQVIVATSTDVDYTFDGDLDTGMNREGADNLGFYTGGTKRLDIDSSGNLGMNNDAWFRAKNNADSDNVNMFKVNTDDEIEVGATLLIGPIEQPTDGGAVTAMDMPVGTNTAGDEMSYTFKVDGVNFLTLYSEADGSGGIQNERVDYLGWTMSTSTVVCMEPDQCEYQCDGTADDVQIQAAVDAQPTNGGKIFAKKGIYDFSDNILIDKNNITIQGEGKSTVFKIANSVNKYAIIIDDTELRYNLIFRDFKIDANDANQSSGGGIMASSTSESIFENLHITEFKEYGIKFGPRSNNDYGFNNIVKKCLIDQGTTGLYFINNDENEITENHISNNTAYAIHSTSPNQKIMNNSFTHSSVASGVGVFIDNAGNCTISGNIFDTIQEEAIIYNGGSGTNDYGIISTNEIFDSGAKTANTYSAILVENDGDNFTVSTNIVKGSNHKYAYDDTAGGKASLIGNKFASGGTGICNNVSYFTGYGMNFGYGTTTPQYPLVLNTTGYTGADFQLNSGDNSDAQLIFGNDSNPNKFSFGWDRANDLFRIRPENWGNNVFTVLQNGNLGIGTDTPNESLTLYEGILSFKETTTPTATADYGKLYTKTDNKAYFQDGAGSEHEIAFTGSYYAEMYLDDNSTATTIETADTPIMLNHFTTGSLANFTFSAGSTGAITAYSDGTSKVNVASATHGLITGDEVSIRGTTNYNGIWTITKIDDGNFSIPDTWVANDGASDWDEGSHLIAGTGSAGLYNMVFSGSCSEGGGAGSNVIGRIYINSTACDKCVAKRKFANNDYGNLPSTAVITVADNDKIYFTIESSGVNAITCQYGNFNIHKL